MSAVSDGRHKDQSTLTVLWPQVSKVSCNRTSYCPSVTEAFEMEFYSIQRAKDTYFLTFSHISHTSYFLTVSLSYNFHHSRLEVPCTSPQSLNFAP
jgi:hypothetical protein